MMLHCRFTQVAGSSRKNEKRKTVFMGTKFHKNRFEKVKLAVPKNLKMFIQMLHKSRSSLQGGIKGLHR